MKKEVPVPLVVEDLISCNLNCQKLARLIECFRNVFSYISQGMAFLVQGVTDV